jgi:anti-anti-sigma factor
MRVVSVREGSEPESLGLRVRTESSSRTILLEGELDLASDLASKDVFSEAIGPLIQHGEPVTVDLERLQFMDSSGLRAVIMASRRAEAMVLRSPRGQVDQLFRLCDLDRLENVTLEDVPDG